MFVWGSAGRKHKLLGITLKMLASFDTDDISEIYTCLIALHF